jgi:tetratricopeptide (TPR) repeat protein
MRALLFVTMGVALGSVACSSAQHPAPATPTTTVATPPPATNVGTTVISGSGESGTALELFERGKKLLLEEKYKEAADTFDLVLKGDPQGRLAPMALLHAGIAAAGAGDRDRALGRFSQLIDSFPQDELVKLALQRSSRILVRAEKWEALARTSEKLLARTDLTILETIEGLGARGLALAETGELDQGARWVDKARDLMEKNHIAEEGKIPDEVAQVYFALGEVRRLKSEQIKFDPPPPNFGETFETRAQGLLDAQAAYTDAMRTTDATWATMSGYRIGQLYQALHHDVMVMKAPTVAKTEKDKQLFEGAMRLRYRVLLEKGLKMMDATLRMNQRVGEETAWTARTRQSKAELEREIAVQKAELDKLPIREEDLKKLLEEVKQRAREREAKEKK